MFFQLSMINGFLIKYQLYDNFSALKTEIWFQAQFFYLSREHIFKILNIGPGKGVS
jgi:hypothetical protein